MRQSKSGGKWNDFTDFNAGDGDFAKYPKRRTVHRYRANSKILAGTGESTWDPLNACELAPNSANT